MASAASVVCVVAEEGHTWGYRRSYRNILRFLELNSFLLMKKLFFMIEMSGLAISYNIGGTHSVCKR